jgi:hypothetical protein
MPKEQIFDPMEPKTLLARIMQLVVDQIQKQQY